ncbi:MAG TPA: BamA/TamA family outer membrane protein [Pirellulaceae bacterium]|nr:BamA/TamA family outer membrane protein [Pirellulaceae bacterium]
MFVSRTFALLTLSALLAATCGCAGAGPWGPAGCGSCAAYRPESPVIAPDARQVAQVAAQENSGLLVRAQSPGEYQPGSGNYLREPQPVSGGAPQVASNPAPAFGAPPAGYAAPPAGYSAPPANFTPPPYQPAQPNVAYQPAPGGFGAPPLPPPPAEVMPPITPAYPGFMPPSNFPDVNATPTPLDVFVEETRTGKFMFGVAVNSDAGVTAQITIDERNFDITKPPTSWDDFLNGTAWRGAGQGFRIEAQPGNQVQRYLVSFTDPYFLDTNISFSASGFYFDRNYFDWDESRYGGRLGWGYRLTPDLSLSTSVGGQNVQIFNPRVLGVPELDAVLGKSDLFTGRVTLTHDTRDIPFMPTEGHLIELSYEQAFGSFDYPRGEVEFSQYFMLRERPDGSGRHTLAYSTRFGISGADTPLYENYFAGGFSTLRGYAFRGASPIDMGVRVGGQLRWLNTLEYFFPLTADDMIRGTVFCDFGTVERDIALNADNFRVAPGVGLRINVPALGPAPLAFDFAFPLHSAPGDDEQMFSFFFGAMR